MEKIAFLLPAYNVEDQISELLTKLTNSYGAHEIVVVNDGSTDNTERLVSAFSLVTCLKHEKNLGKGAALATGIQYLKEIEGIKGICFMDADGQHSPEHVSDFINAFEESKSDFLIGCRDFQIGEMPLLRIVSNKITSALISCRLRRRIHDSQCGYRLISMNLLKKMPTLKAQKYDFETELLILAARHGAKFHHVKVRTIYRRERSHISHFKDTLRFLKTLMTT